MNILSGWNLLFGVNSLLYFKVDALPCLLNIFNHLLSDSASKSLRLIQKYLLSSLIIVSKSHLKQFFLVMSNIFIIGKKNFFLFLLIFFILYC